MLLHAFQTDRNLADMLQRRGAPLVQVECLPVAAGKVPPPPSPSRRAASPPPSPPALPD